MERYESFAGPPKCFAIQNGNYEILNLKHSYWGISAAEYTNRNGTGRCGILDTIQQVQPCRIIGHGHTYLIGCHQSLPCPRVKAWRKLWGRRERECPGRGGGIIHIFPETNECVCYPFTGADKQFFNGGGSYLEVAESMGHVSKMLQFENWN